MKSMYGKGLNGQDKHMILAAITAFVPDKCYMCDEEMIKRGTGEGENESEIADYVRFQDGKFAHLACYLKEIESVKSIIEGVNEKKSDEK